MDLTRDEWSALREKTTLPLSAEEVERLRGLGDVIDLNEVWDVCLPRSRLLNLYVQATAELRGALNTFLGDARNGHGAQRGTPFVIGVAGSVAVGKSTVARDSTIVRAHQHAAGARKEGHRLNRTATRSAGPAAD